MQRREAQDTARDTENIREKNSQLSKPMNHHTPHSIPRRPPGGNLETNKENLQKTARGKKRNHRHYPWNRAMGAVAADHFACVKDFFGGEKRRTSAGRLGGKGDLPVIKKKKKNGGSALRQRITTVPTMVGDPTQNNAASGCKRGME